MTIRTMLDATVQKAPGAVALRFCCRGAWAARTYGEFYSRIRQAAEAAGRLGIVPGRDPVALLLENGPEWMEIYAALAGAGVTVVPIDPRLRPREIAYILGNAEAAAIFTSGRQRDCLQEILPELPCLRHLVLVDGAEAARTPCAGRSCRDYETALGEVAAAAAAPGAWFDRHRPGDETVASIIYTSGTTGKPKGAMLTHGNFGADIEGSFGIISDLRPADSFLVVLPLFHAFSFTANFLMPLCRGSSMCFVESLRTVGDDLRALRPTVLMAVPLLVEKIYDRIEGGIRASALARLLLKLGLGRVVGATVRKSLGGRLRLLLVGGAPCPVRVLQGFRRLGVNIIEGYGLTEASPVVSLSRPGDARPGTIGYKLPNIEVRLAEPDGQGVGELQVRGPIVMKGYYRDAAATAEAFDGPWLRTGDLASIDADGFITIRGRRKALIVNREGKNIYPEEVEQCIARNPAVLDVVVVGYHEGGETGEKVGAILTPNLTVIQAQHPGVAPPWAAVEALLRQAVHDQCRDLADYKHPRKIEVRRDPLERTSIQKIRRVVYQGQLDVACSPRMD
ncbi:MAG: AMP-binding protein [bacterium]